MLILGLGLAGIGLARRKKKSGQSRFDEAGNTPFAPIEINTCRKLTSVTFFKTTSY
jgi:hypothetical protein